VNTPHCYVTLTLPHFLKNCLSRRVSEGEIRKATPPITVTARSKGCHGTVHITNMEIADSITSRDTEIYLHFLCFYLPCRNEPCRGPIPRPSLTIRGLFKKYPDWNCSGCSLGGMYLQPVLTCSYMS